MSISRRPLQFFWLSLCSLLCVPGAFAASTIHGTVTNGTTGKPAAGDEVTLIRLAQGMLPAGSTKTDAKGKFTLNVDDDGMHLVRVTHDKANYFQAVQPGADSVDVDVFTAEAKVQGVTNEAEVMHMQTDPSGKLLQVVATFFVKNMSLPPKTQYSDHAFDFYLPPGAVVEESVAVGPDSMAMPVKTPPVPLDDAPDHYAFVFPLRPCAGAGASSQERGCGETRFQISFHLPYGGSLQIRPKVATPTATLAILLPKSMTFAPAAGVDYTKPTEQMEAQAFVAQNVQPSQPLGFTVSGAGQMPRDVAGAGDTQNSGAADTNAGAGGGGGTDMTPSEASAAQRADTKPGVGLNIPLDANGDLEPWAKYKWWIITVLGLALAAGAGVMLKAAPAGGSAPPLPSAPVGGGVGVASQGTLLGTLKDELFSLETDRLSGNLSEAEYKEHKAALEVVLKRALTRTGDTGATGI